MTHLRRRQWADLPGPARAAIQERIGPVTGVRSAEAGLTSGVATRVTTAEGAAFFVKAAPSTTPVAGHLVRERTANQALPAHLPVPRMVWTSDMLGWHLLVFECAPGREADLSSGSLDVSAVMGALAAISIPCPWQDAPSITAKVVALLRHAETLMTDSPAEHVRYEPLVKALEPDDLTGETLLHADLHAGNLLVDGDRCRIVDWSMACRGAAWVEVALLIPRLIDAGHAPADAEDIAARVPSWHSAPADTVTALAATRALFATRMAEVGPVHLRAKRRRTAAACRAWVEHRGHGP